MFLTIFGFPHDKSTIEYIKNKGIKTVCWWLNDPFQFERSIKQASFYDYYFTNSKGSVHYYKKAGVKNVFYLPVGIYPPVHKKLENIEKKYDICFAGDWNPVRAEFLTLLSKEFHISIFGPWKKKVKNNKILAKNIVKNGFFSPQEMVKIFNESKIVLNIHSWFGKWNYGINPRVFEANGCGAFQIVDYKEEIEDIFEHKKEIIFYRNIEELKEALSFFLAHDRERVRIAENGYLKTIKYHTYEHRLKEMFYIIGVK